MKNKEKISKKNKNFSIPLNIIKNIINYYSNILY